ncbi:MAG: PASTA domain-containing protein, partial [Ignavibacteria bacterium]
VSAPVFKNILKRIYDLEKGKYNPTKPGTEIKIAINKNQISEFVNHELQHGNELNESRNVFASDNSRNLMPDLRGKTLKEALSVLNDLGIRWSISGSGVVAGQSISPGQLLDKKQTCVLTCSQMSTTGARIY